MPLVHENFTQLTDLDPVLTEIFYQAYQQVQPVRPQLFGLRTSTKSQETDLRIGSFSDPVEFDGAVQYETPRRDYTITYAHSHFVKGFSIEQTLLEDMQYDNIFSSASDLGTAFARKMEKDAASVFNNAFTAGTTAGYDAVALCSDSHPRSRTDATLVDNSLALSLTSDNLETAITTMQAFGDDLGEEITIMPDTLVVPRALRKKALEIAGSDKVPENANNTYNVNQGMRVVSWNFLTDTNAWFVIDSAMAQRYLKWYDRITTQFGAVEDFDKLIRKYRGRMRYSFGWSDFRFIIGSNPS